MDASVTTWGVHDIDSMPLMLPTLAPLARERARMDIPRETLSSLSLLPAWTISESDEHAWLAPVLLLGTAATSGSLPLQLPNECDSPFLFRVFFSFAFHWFALSLIVC